MTWTNLDDILGQLRNADFIVEAADIKPGRRQRAKVSGLTQKGWYSLYEMQLDGGALALVGAYGTWKGAEEFVAKFALNIEGKAAKLTEAERAAQKARWAADKAEHERQTAQKQAAAASRAAGWWRQLQDAGESGYMAKKGFAASDLFGARVSKSGSLVVPMQDTTGAIHGLQVIYPTKNRHGRDKDFTPPGLAKKGHFFPMGVVARGGVVLLCEGFATGASLRLATGLPVVVAFDANNLTPVALAIHKAHRKDVRILICADDDYHTMAKTGKNSGIEGAKLAALGVDGQVVWPTFPDERPTDTKGPTDFNDLHTHPGGGLAMVRQQIEAALALAGWRVRTPAAAAVPALQGGGERPAAGERIRAQAIMPLDDVVARFIPLDDGTGDYVWDTWTAKIVKQKQMHTLLPAGVRGDDIKRHPYWIERGAYFLDQVGFDPTGQDPAVQLNTWRGWPLTPAAKGDGSCERLLELLRYLCGEDRVFYWLLCWMAWPLQHPGAKMGSAVIMHGPQGTGKSVIFNRVLASIYGNYATVLNQRGLEDRFNADWIDSKLYMCAEEVVARAEMWHIKNELKELVTGEWIRVNPKNVAAYRQRNQINVVYLSNEGQPLPIDNDDRRHLVVYTPPKLSPDFYDEVFAEIDAGGVRAFYAYLLNLDIEATCPGFHPKKHPPMTEAKQALIDLSAPSESRFIRDWLHGEADLPVCPALALDVYEAYLRWCRRNGEGRPRASNHFIGSIDRLGGWAKKKVECSLKPGADPRIQSVIFPPDQALQAAGTDHRPGTTQKRWVSDSVQAFHDATFKERDRWAA